ncbi:hypothetical protein [Atopobacter sp. AH10]|nr:hypothetical protein [Atopobacter sp. AH10]
MICTKVGLLYQLMNNEKIKKEIVDMKNIKVRKAESANATAWWIVI